MVGPEGAGRWALGHLQELGGSCSASAGTQQEQGAEGYGVPRVGHPATCRAHPAHPAPTTTLGVRFGCWPHLQMPAWGGEKCCLRMLVKGARKVSGLLIYTPRWLEGASSSGALSRVPGSCWGPRGTPAVQCTSGPAMPPSRCQSSPHRSPCNRRVLCTREPQKLDHKSELRGLVEEGEEGCGGATQRRDSAAKARGAHAHAETPGDGCQHEEIKVSDKQINHLKGFIEGRN